MIGKLLRRLVLAVALPALMFTSAQPALADPPVPVEPQTFPDFPAGSACPDFALRLEQSGGNLHTKEFKDRNDNPVKVIQAGKGFLLTFTNLKTGESLAIQSRGSVSKTTPTGDGSNTNTVQSTGHNVIILFPTDQPAGPSTILYVGRVVYTADAANNFVVQSTSGTQTDICAQLAP